ncbi:ATP-binding cassette domain-containing protein [Glutamicibacter sp. MNS18]|uniref:ABC-F family ATP-binding cassette domain-containing protein n=1 Tax=Glutamicibacter sp. MNS18 TaxID=2989817 RepID=UPI0022363556|nr:ABC-F family ATP-binding cassette domain-containing protein [Glutamicibacter sp. MNS18]MCW4465940.1 ATP-binding cassette domain-containing protein [Glutamicibacter sp. MNS18]
MPTISPHAAGSRAQLSAQEITVGFGSRPVLENISLCLNPASRLAVIGENGRGKSTLLQVLAGLRTPDSGHVQVNGSVGFAHQEMHFDPEATIGDLVAQATAASRLALSGLHAAAQDLASGQSGSEQRYAQALEQATALDAWDAERRVDLALQALHAETNRERKLDELSVGQRYRVRLACLLGGTDDFLLLDEPTNHLDAPSLAFLADSISGRRGAVVMVSHDRILLRRCATSFLDLDPSADGRPLAYTGDYDGYRLARMAERERWDQLYLRQQQEHAKLQQDLSAAQDRLVSGWRPPKGTGKHARATRAGSLVRSVHQRRERLESHSVDLPPAPRHFRLPVLGARPGIELLRASDLTVSGRLDTPVCLALHAGSRLVVTGPNGAGKSTLLQVLSGNLEPSRGQLHHAAALRAGYLPQESTLPAELRASDVYRQQVQRIVSRGIISAEHAVGLPELGLLRTAEAAQRIGELSMGQQRRLQLAMVLAARPHVLLLDEPTNHLSMALVDELTEALQATGAAVVLGTHDRQLLSDTGRWPRLRLESSNH